MKPTNHFSTFILLAVVFVLTSTGFAQDSKPADRQAAPDQRPMLKQMHAHRAEFLHQLGLNEEQMQQIRKLHLEQRALMDAAQKHLRETNRALNEAIYADQLNEAEVEARIRDRQAAQADVDKLRFTTELAVRRILTPEQLVRFRELRQQFEKVREGIEKRRPFQGDKPFTRQRPAKDGNRTQTPEPSAQPVKQMRPVI